MMALGVYCECGQLLTVVENQAGSAISCSCRRKVVVPLLEEFADRPLLLSAATIERRLRRLIAAGELPLVSCCLRCGEVHSLEVVPVELECERYTVRAHGGQRFLILPLLPYILLLRWREEERLEIRGRDTDLRAPICLCESCRRQLDETTRPVYLIFAAVLVAVAGLVGYFNVLAAIGVAAVGLVALALRRRRTFMRRQRTLKSLLRQVPIYRQILDRYPHAVVVLPNPMPAQPEDQRNVSGFNNA
jgi:hypothetical protein